MKNTLIAILVLIILVLGYFFIKEKNQDDNRNPWPETEPATPTNTNSNNNLQSNTNAGQNNNSGLVAVDLGLKLFTRANYSFQAPESWNETGPSDFEGCAWDGVSNDTSDGMRMAGEVGIYPKSCFDISKANGYKQMTEVDGFYILAYYDKDSGTTAQEEAETKAVYLNIVNTFQAR